MSDSKPAAAAQTLRLMLFWLYVTIPLTWGVWSTVKKALALFQ